MSRSHTSLYLAATGMITPVGFDAVSTAAAVRAGIGEHRLTDYRNKVLEPMIMALVPDAALPPQFAGLIASALGMGVGSVLATTRRR